jgi:hypothetical protein
MNSASLVELLKHLMKVEENGVNKDKSKEISDAVQQKVLSFSQ